MSQITGLLSDESYLVLDESLPVIHSALVHLYGYSDSEAEAFNDTLALWFHRVARRSEGRLDLFELRDQLLFVACKYARAFRVAQFRSFDPAIARAPEEVAMALLTCLPSRERRA